LRLKIYRALLSSLLLLHVSSIFLNNLDWSPFIQCLYPYYYPYIQWSGQRQDWGMYQNPDQFDQQINYGIILANGVNKKSSALSKTVLVCFTFRELFPQGREQERSFTQMEIDPHENLTFKKITFSNLSEKLLHPEFFRRLKNTHYKKSMLLVLLAPLQFCSRTKKFLEIPVSDPSWATYWDRFWFAPKPQAILTIMRMSYGTYLIFYFWKLQPVMEMFFGTNGLVALGGRFPQQPSPVPTIFTVLSDRSDTVVWFVTLLGMFSGAILATGVFNRVAALLAWVCVSSVVTAIPVNSGDFLVQCYAVLMVFAGLAGHLGKPVWQCSTGEHPAWSLRLFQIQIVFVYFFSGWHKLASTAWYNGSAFHYVISQEFWSRFDITWLAAYPVFTSALTTFVLFFELLLFPVLIWVPATRRLMLVSGLIFHLMIFATLKVFVFHQIVILFYLAFLTSDDISQFKNHLESVLKKRIPILLNNLRSHHK